MRSIGVLLLTFLLLALESPFLHRGSVVQYTPDLALLVVIYIGQTSSREGGVLLALCLGLIKDGFALGATPVGMYSELFVLAFLVSHQLSKRLAVRGAVTTMLVALLFVIGTSLLELLLSLLFVKTAAEGAGTTVILSSMIPQALATAPFAPVIFWLFDKLDGVTIRKRDSVMMG